MLAKKAVMNSHWRTVAIDAWDNRWLSIHTPYSGFMSPWAERVGQGYMGGFTQMVKIVPASLGWAVESTCLELGSCIIILLLITYSHTHTIFLCCQCSQLRCSEASWEWWGHPDTDGDVWNTSVICHRCTSPTMRQWNDWQRRSSLYVLRQLAVVLDLHGGFSLRFVCVSVVHAFCYFDFFL